jgi:hypothetical protein
MTPQENVAYLEAVLAKAKRGAAPTATAMARYIADRARTDTLRRSSHSPGEWHRTRPGEPPAYSSGNLSRSMTYKPASQGLRATAMAGNAASYSRILEFGCVVTPVSGKKFMHWVDSGGSWYHEMLVIPPHPFLEPTTDESIRDGSLRDVAIDEFRKYDP